MIYILRCKNSSVTDYYLDVMGNIFKNCNYKIRDYNKNQKIYNSDYIIVASVIDFLRMYLIGHNKIIYWMQGIESEESFLNHKSIIRKKILDIFTKLALKKSKIIFFVSKEMLEFEMNKFKLDIKEKSFIMPCFNTDCKFNSMKCKEKYKKNIFTYVGSLSSWQCFDETVDYYKNIENKYNNVMLKVFTPEIEKAKKILVEKKIKKFTVSYVKPEKLHEVLSDVKFGFVIRKNIPINNVATPTKLSTYLSNGIIPIYSNSLKDFYNVSKKMKYVVPINDNHISDNLEKLINDKIDMVELKKEYETLFSTYYNPDFYKKKYTKKICTILKK